MNSVLFHVKTAHSNDYKSMMVLQDRVNLVKDEPGACNEACSVSSDDGNQFLFIKVENVTDIKEDDDTKPMTSPVIKTEHEVSCMSVCPALSAFHKYTWPSFFCFCALMVLENLFHFLICTLSFSV